MKRKFILSAIAVVSIVIFALLGYLFIIFMGNYVIDEEKLVMNTASKLVDEEGNEITKLYVENRELVDISDIPEYVQQAFISVEDQRFYDHHGIDIDRKSVV